ncbi:anhydro-N-acetylmuramic acid kinase [Flavobacterium salilacus subsp. salilacus]|uniref:anhydro-N-acetylmuramic acid kinase n=1 Tax=Flavobacterium TaxID=237 RepID=UPI0010753DAB|nr:MULTISPECIES: anhydro-N-acetylmuramic acid kinase [Flavobacterium]KAF2519641.1 anhydro-N-acetylmuramic acid kinase [Flavobacterium salilacus subsp. salilacus]MBE1614457.1 anhydro-N-acetylmuramic acid kinase [Flavobacterium sp. SaA2.13]
MNKQNYNVLGVMSGTSLDGVDLAHISLTLQEQKWSYAIHETQTISYSPEWVKRLQSAIDFDINTLAQLNQDYTVLLANIINGFITQNAIGNLDAVCSHGHTILHQPHNGFTLQIGNLPQIANLIHHTIVCDFRVQDVAMGGQGAPLVPMGDRLLFSEYDFCLNLGGFSNISFEEDGQRIAYDICPVNTVLNYYAGILGHAYDDGGAIAAAGTVVPELLEALNNLDYYKAPYPKSLGFEFVKEVILPVMERSDAAVKDKLCTFTTHSATQIAKAIIAKKANGSLLITGGGAYNSFLIKKVKEFLPATRLVIPDNKTIQYKEALLFALLGVLKLRNEVNVLCSVTGAKANHSSGVIMQPTTHPFS